MGGEVLRQAEIAVIREFDTVLGDNWDPPHCRASQSECDELSESLEVRGYLYSRTDRGWEGYVDATDKGRAQYEHWTGESRFREQQIRSLQLELAAAKSELRRAEERVAAIEIRLKEAEQ